MNLELKNILRENKENIKFIISKEDLGKVDQYFKSSKLVEASLVGKEAKQRNIFKKYMHTMADDGRINDFIIFIKDFKELDVHIGYFDLMEVLLDGMHRLEFVPEKYVKAMDNDIKNDFLNQWFTGKKEKVVITHEGCTDGTGVAMAVIKTTTELSPNQDTNSENNTLSILYADYKKYNLQHLLVELKDKIVFVGDFSFPMEELIEIKKVVSNIVIVDHHGTPFKSDVGSLPYTHFDMSKSGAVLAWEFFSSFNTKTPSEAPLILKLIEDRDLWNFFYGDLSKAAALMVKEKSIENCHSMLSDTNFDNNMLRLELAGYTDRLRYMERSYTERAMDAIPYVIKGYVFYGINYISSEVQNEISRIFKTPSFGYTIDNKTNSIKLSLRNHIADINVATVAEQIGFGGGGHAQAAGVRIPIDRIDLIEFFVNKKIKVNK